MERIVCLAVGYLIGCIQTAFIVGEIVGKIDIRNFGSGNAGTTNVTRVLGAKAGLIVFLGDLLKVIIAYSICSILFDGSGTFFKGMSLLPGLYAGLGAVLGHNFPFYLKFRGGKGIACTLGLMLCIDIKVAGLTYLIGFIFFIIFRFVSLSSLIMALLAPIIMIIFGFETEPVVLMFVLAASAYYKHIPNIKRLIKGEESKFSFKKIK